MCEVRKKPVKGTTSLGFLSSAKAHFCMCVNISSLTIQNTKSCSACKSKTEPAVSLHVWEFGYNESYVNYFNKNSVLKYFNNDFTWIIPYFSVFLYTLYHPTAFLPPLLVFAYCIFLLKLSFECVILLFSSPLLPYSFTVFKENTNSSIFCCCRGEEAIMLVWLLLNTLSVTILKMKYLLYSCNTSSGKLVAILHLTTYKILITCSLCADVSSTLRDNTLKLGV